MAEAAAVAAVATATAEKEAAAATAAAAAATVAAAAAVGDPMLSPREGAAGAAGVPETPALLREALNEVGGGNVSGGALTLDASELRFGRCIAEGEFAEVYRGLLWSQKVAIKQLKWRDDSTESSLLSELHHETSLLAAMRHPAILSLIGCVSDPQKPCLVLEHLEGTLCAVGHFASLPLQRVVESF